MDPDVWGDSDGENGGCGDTDLQLAQREQQRREEQRITVRE
jgi:hypothetical protein